VNDRAPTNEDLMLYADGELDPERSADVEAYLAQDSHAQAVVATIHELGSQVRAFADDQARDAGADDIASWVMSRIEQEKAPNVVALPTEPRAQTGPTRPTTGSVWPLALGALAAAAAVALVVWRFAGLDLTVPGEPSVAEAVPSAKPEMVASAPAPAPDYDPEPGVSVDAIDFGARTGTIFYVPSDTGTTTVVWLSDDEAN
jgi:anti-sigma factor RsiW